MPIRRASVAIAAALLLCAAARDAWALAPGEVLVIANQASADSLEVAQAYLKARNIPTENLVLLKTSTQYEVSPDDYQQQIRQPLLDTIAQRKAERQIRCLCLIYGMPVRISAPPTAAATAVTTPPAATRAHYRMAIDLQLMANVGLAMPTSQPADLRPVNKFFDLSPQPKEPLASVDSLRQDLLHLRVSKPQDIAKMSNPTHQKLASRQFMALCLDLYGLKGLIAYITDNHPPGAPDLAALQRELDEAQAQMDKLSNSPPTPQVLADKIPLMEKIGGLVLVCAAEPTAAAAPLKASDNAVDSELALLLWPAGDRERIGRAAAGNVPAGSMPNPLHWRVRASGPLPPTLMTARLDGPSKQDVMRMIADSLAVEQTGLKGTFYIDAGVTMISNKKAPAYALFDQHLKNLAAFLTANTTLKVVLDEKEAVFPAGSCPDAALYVGWYSLANYVPAFKWVRGAVGYHIASFEAKHLRDPKSSEWCPRMIQEGVAATWGPVFEPYLAAFPAPDEFFPLLLTGKWTVAECYWRTCPQTFWKMTLIADPLYNPFAKAPALEASRVPPGLAP